MLGHLSEAEGAFQAVVALEPDSGAAHYDLGMVQLQLGQYEAALKNVTRSNELGASNPAQQSDLTCLRYFLGFVLRSDILTALDQAPVSAIGGTSMFALVEHADRAQRAPETVLRKLAEGASFSDSTSWAFTIEAVANDVVKGNQRPLTSSDALISAERQGPAGTGWGAERNGRKRQRNSRT